MHTQEIGSGAALPMTGDLVENSPHDSTGTEPGSAAAAPVKRTAVTTESATVPEAAKGDKVISKQVVVISVETYLPNVTHGRNCNSSLGLPFHFACQLHQLPCLVFFKAYEQTCRVHMQ